MRPLLSLELGWLETTDRTHRLRTAGHRSGRWALLVGSFDSPERCAG